MILITGFTGNTGRLVLKKLAATEKPQNLIGISRTALKENPFGIISEVGDLNDFDFLNKLFSKYPINSIIHIANIRYSPSILNKANEYGVEKVVLIHTTGVYSKYRSYNALYQEIEEKIMKMSYPHTNYIILRPTMIYGNHRDHNMHKLIKFINTIPVFPVFGDGSALMQPVHVEDLASATISAHNSKYINNEDFVLSGGSVVTYKEVITTIKDELGKKTKLFYIPIKLAVFGAGILSKMFSKPIISVEQVKRLQEDKAYPNEKARKLLNYNPRSFNEGIVQEINLLREKGIIK
ncbi:NAD-dependent epimerase/dehydratase family protein [Metaplanococcus flavidus]